MTALSQLVVIDVGAGSELPTVRRTAEDMARQFDGTLLRMNPREAEIPRSVRGYSIPYGALEGLKKLMDELENI